MKNKGMLFLIISFLLGAATFVGIFLYINKLDDRVSVVVAKQDIGPYQKITQDMLDLEYRSTDGIKGSYTSEKSNIEGFYTDSVGLHQGDVVTREKVKKKDEIIDHIMSYEVPEGKVAVAAEVDFVRSVSGAVKSGDYVDISVITDKVQITPIESIKVISVQDKEGREITQSVEKVQIPSSVVFEATPETRDTIVYINSKGKIHLSLRNPNDIKDTSVNKEVLQKLEQTDQETSQTQQGIKTEQKQGQSIAYPNF